MPDNKERKDPVKDPLNPAKDPMSDPGRQGGGTGGGKSGAGQGTGGTRPNQPGQRDRPDGDADDLDR